MQKGNYATLILSIIRRTFVPMHKTIEIRTTQNVTIEYELAGLRERALAWLLDSFLLVVAYFMLFTVLTTIFGSGWLNDGGWVRVIVFLPFLLLFGYHTLFEIMNGGQSLGKKAMAIKVVRLDGKDPEWGDVVLRVLLQLVDSVFSSGVIGALLIKTTPKSQRLGDMAANTTVIKIGNARFQFSLGDILRISSLDNYQPVFPQVRTLAERDMIFIKNTISRYQEYPNNAHHEVVEDLVTHLMPILNIEQRPLNRIEFLKTLLRDYIVLTR